MRRASQVRTMFGLSWNRLHVTWLVGLCFGTLACGDAAAIFDEGGDGGGASGGSGGSGGDATDPPPLPKAPELDIQWSPCSWETSGGPNDAECADIEVPLDWWQPDGERITLYLKRGGQIGDPDAKQLWFVMGGPGGASEGYEPIGRTMFESVPPLEVYLLDHRGVGRSTRLGCSAENDASEEGYAITMEEWPACIDEVVAEWGDGLDNFSTTQAAVDLGVLVDQTQRPGQATHVHGGSYGTYWAQRYLQLFPEQSEAVSMLGVVNPVVFTFANYDDQYEANGADFLARCAADPFCMSKVGPDPEAFMRGVYDEVDTVCPQAGVDRQTLRIYAGSFLLFGWDERVLPLALAYRLARCDPQDVTAIQTFLSNVPPPIDSITEDRLRGQILGMHIGTSELWSDDLPSVEDADAVAENGLFAFGGTGRRIELTPIWPTYDDVHYDDRWAETSIPLLMINGELDPATTQAEAIGVGDHFGGALQRFVTIPDGSHGWSSPTTQGYGCALNMFAGFVLEPTEPLLDCIPIVLPVDFRGTGTLASLMGTADIWDNGTTMLTDPDPDTQQGANETLRLAARMRLR